MAIIPLRAYNREIEGMIDNGQLDEAVAHCRHILATYPKHIATYRLLGKAHLEQQRISDATDIFQRVLSAIPDDFIANVGMSIIREDENNLDASIWHMELAYESQPSNIAIQDELRRLYGRRDGMQPPKVRLTRGALARMYAKGGLLDQAVAELRVAISEDPNRYDLQLLLAGMFFQTSQRVEAVETCANILKKLPFCLAANQILAVSLPEAEQSATGKNYRQIAISMDPYYAFAAQDAITSDQVADNAVNIERLEWKPGIQISDATQPTWATSLGVSLEKPAEEKLPEWLKGTEAPATAEVSEKAQPSVSPFIWDTQEVEKIITDDTKPEAEIPDWMKDAGWKPATGEIAQEPSVAISEPPSIESQQKEDVEKADIPDWLRGIAPEGVLEAEPATSQSMDKDASIPWLEKQQPGPTDSIIQWLEDAKPETPAITPEPEGTSAEVSDEEIPDWLKDLDVPYPPLAQGEQTPEEIAASSAVTPAFIEEPVVGEPSESLETKDLQLEGTPGQEEKIEPIPEIAETQPASTVLETEELPAVSSEELPDWIKELAGEAPEATPSVISEEELTAEKFKVEEPITEIPSVSEEVPTAELPLAAKEVVIEEPEVTKAEEPTEAVSAEETPAEEVSIVSEEEPTVGLPVTLGEVSVAEVPTRIEEEVQEEQPLGKEGKTKHEVSITPGEAAVVAGLVGLVIEKGKEEQEPITPVEEQVAITPSEEQEQITSAELQEPIAPVEERVTITPAEEPGPITPVEEQVAAPTEWVKLEAAAISAETISELKPEAEEAPAIPAEEIPEWIKGLGETPEIEEASIESASAITPEAEIPQAEELPAWLLESEQTEEKKEAPLSSTGVLEWKEEELPDWIKEITETTPSKEIPTTIEQPVSEELLAAPSEPVSEGVSEEVPVAEISEVKTLESQPAEPAWVPEAELPIQPVAPEPVEAEVETTVAPPEQPVMPPIEAPEAELTTLEDARKAINEGQPDQAAEIYTGLVKQNLHLEEVITDVQEALYRFPVDVNLWVVLGDAYLRMDELQEALNVYSKAEDLVR